MVLKYKYNYIMSQNNPVGITQVMVTNQRPSDYFNVTAEIPANTSTYLKTGNLIPFPLLQTNDLVITSIKIFANSNSVYNVPIINNVIVNAVPVQITPGWYPEGDLVTLLSITIGINSSKVTTTVPLDLTNAPDIKAILGFTTDLVAAGVTSPSIIDITNGYDVICINNNLIQLSDTSGTKYIDQIRILDSLGNFIQNVNDNLMIPTIQGACNEVTWNLYKRDGKSPYKFQSPVNIFLQILCYPRTKQ